MRMNERRASSDIRIELKEDEQQQEEGEKEKGRERERERSDLTLYFFNIVGEFLVPGWNSILSRLTLCHEWSRHHAPTNRPSRTEPNLTERTN